MPTVDGDRVSDLRHGADADSDQAGIETPTEQRLWIASAAEKWGGLFVMAGTPERIVGREAHEIREIRRPLGISER